MGDSIYPLRTVDGRFDLTRRSDDWHACIAGDPKRWGCGDSPEAAISSVLRVHDAPHPELFCADDGGGGPYWLVADGLTALDAAKLVWSVDSLTDGFTVEPVRGRVDGQGEERHVTVIDDGTVDLWEVQLP